MNEPRLRLFVAVDLPAGVRSAVADAVESLRADDGVRWTDPASWHVTLAFLGAVSAARVPDIEAALEEVATRHAPFELRITGAAGMFGRRVLWAEIADSPALAALADDVRAALEPLGFPRETRPFHAHLTLARARQGASLPRDLTAGYAGEPRSWTVEHLNLMRSHLGRSGARYERVGSWPLTGAQRTA